MRGRLAPLENQPEHQLEIDYLRDLTVAIKQQYYDLPESVYRRVLSLDLLAEWNLVHRPPLARCEGFRGGIPHFTPDGSIKAHETELKQIDALVDRLKDALTNQVRIIDAITLEDIETLEQAYRALKVCERKLIWY